MEDKKQRLKELWAQYEAAKAVAQDLYRQHGRLRDEIAISEAKFPIGSVIGIAKGRWNGETHEEFQERFRITRITGSYVYANRLRKDGSDGVERRLYDWDIRKAELMEPPK
jgi:hypothetical protein